MSITNGGVLPIELWLHILEFTDVRTVSKMCCVNMFFNQLVAQHRWEIVDHIISRSDNIEIVIPATSETYKAYSYIVDFHNVLLSTQSRKPRLSTDVLYAILEENLYDLNVLGQCCTYSEGFISSKWMHMDTEILARCQILPLSLITCLMERYNENPVALARTTDMICQHQMIPLWLIDRFPECINWHALSQNKETLTVEVIRKYRNKLVWPEVTKHGLVEDYIVEFMNHLTEFCWRNISCYSRLSDDFIIQNRKRLHTQSLLVFQKMQCSTIIQLIAPGGDDVWDLASQHQSLTYDFIKKYKRQLNLRKLITNKDISRRHLYNVFKRH